MHQLPPSERDDERIGRQATEALQDLRVLARLLRSLTAEQVQVLFARPAARPPFVAVVGSNAEQIEAVRDVITLMLADLKGVATLNPLDAQFSVRLTPKMYLLEPSGIMHEIDLRPQDPMRQEGQ